MKARKTLAHQQLVGEVLTQLAFFKPDPKVGRQAVDRLTDRELRWYPLLRLFFLSSAKFNHPPPPLHPPPYFSSLQVIKRRIEALIDREYLERDADNGSNYRYLA
jgi:hypothetical protein